MTEDRSEIQKVVAGDRQAIRRFIEQYRKLVTHIVFKMIPSEHDREDVCQNVFMKLFENLPGFRFESKMSTWIGRIAYTQSLNFLDKMKVPLFEDLVDEDRTVDSVSAEIADPHDLAEQADTADRIRCEIEKLSPPYRTILTLYHLDEMSYNEIGDIMKLPEGTVKSYLFRARRQLKERLLARYGSEERWQ